MIAWDNLVLAYRRCRRRKRYRRGGAAFDFAWESHLLELQAELQAETYTPGPYHHFEIHEPKRRKISAAPFRDRVVHHAIVNILEPLWERRFIHDSYACRRGKGTHRAVDRVQGYLRKYPHCLKTDIVRFFPNIDHEILLATLARTIADSRVMRLVTGIVASGEGVLTDEATPAYFPGDDLWAILRPTGLPIGNLTSQFFANVLLDPVDHFIKEQLRLPGYVRYADDLWLFAETKERLWAARARLAERLAELRLRLHANKTQVVAARQGVSCLGFRVQPHQRRLLGSCLARFRSRCRRQQRAFQARRLELKSVRGSLKAWLAHVRGGCPQALVRRLLHAYGWSRPYQGDTSET